MERRRFIELAGGALAICPFHARAQRAGVPVVGVLSAQSQTSEANVLAEWLKALAETGFVGGRNVAVEYRYADGQGARLPMLAAELIASRIDVLVANTTPPAFAAKPATST